MKTKTKQQQKKTHQKWKQPGFDQGMLGKFVSKKQANIRKGKGNNKKNKRNPQNNVFERGWWTKNKEKWISEREDKNENQERKQNRKKRRILKTGLSGEQKLKKPPTLQETNLFGPFLQNTSTKTQRENKTTKKQKKTVQKKQLFAFWQTTPYFW